jgi:hypothetical protein
MVKFSKTITLETLDSFHPIKFTVIECETKEDADKELNEWIKDYPYLFEVRSKIPSDKERQSVENNKKIIRMALNGK